ncbi:LOW QUALITY PROTEIN: uncharacterized protein C18orf63 homolog [Sceloporus undulatus]|uniref:LOW QUALITY PROTEIN: uncharacterized protein C18orf63 homolog n=1 Tax=Sceloporus undulatus TaxID=8520 RepID=UPI001C4B7ECE|nr:LOW QUALITY PROTEIN: uncharacterized protein C18orf63 homolog [Sceloporus undulatus]
MGDVRRQSLFFISLPELQKLCAVKVIVSSQLAATEIRTAQRKMCRRLVFLYQEVFASPVPGTLNEISAIMPIPFYKSGKFQAYIEKHRATMAMPERVIPATFQICLSYTLIAKLAPKWNQAGHLLIQGKDFLSQHGKQNAVVMDINVFDAQLCISVAVCTIRLPPPKLEDFDIPTNTIKKFDSDDNAVIQRCSILSNWCYVLPSMKMGQIINIGHVIPSESPFQSYSELKLHWKNLYGYSLPEDPQMYCNIYFKLIGEQFFTYPISCIRSQPVQFFPRVDLEGVLDAFATDVKTIIHTCGLSLKMTNKALYATNEFTRASVQKASSKPANLTGSRNCKVTLTQDIPQKGLFSPSACTIKSSHKMELEAKQPNAGIFSNLNLLKKDENPGAMEGEVYSKEQLKTSKGSALMLNSKESFTLSNNSTRKNSTRIIPIFKAKLLQMDRHTTKGTNGKKKQNISQYSPKVMKPNMAAKLPLFKLNPVQLDKSLHDASLSNITNRSIVQTQIGKNNVKPTKLTSKEKNQNGGYLSNGALTNRDILGSNSSKIKPRRLNLSLTSASDQSTHHASAANQHLNKPANLSINHTALITGSKKTCLCISHSDVDENNSTIFQNQIQSSAEEAKMNVYRLSSSVRKRAQKGGEQKESVRPLNQDTTKTSSHHLQFNYKQILMSNESLHCEDMNSCQIYSKSERCLISLPNKSGKRHQEDSISYSKSKKLRSSKPPNSKKEL